MKFDKKLLGPYIAWLIIGALFLVFSLTNFCDISNYVSPNQIGEFLGGNPGFFLGVSFSFIDHLIVFGGLALPLLFFIATLLIIIFNKRTNYIAHLILSLLLTLLLGFSGCIILIYEKNLAASLGIEPKSFVTNMIQVLTHLNLDPSNIPDTIMQVANAIIPALVILFMYVIPLIVLVISNIVLMVRCIVGFKGDDDEDEEDEDEDDEDDKKKKKKSKGKEEKEESKKEPHYYNGLEFIKAFEYYYNYSPKTVISDDEIQAFLDRAKQDTCLDKKVDDIPSYNSQHSQPQPAPVPAAAPQPQVQPQPQVVVAPVVAPAPQPQPQPQPAPAPVAPAPAPAAPTPAPAPVEPAPAPAPAEPTPAPAEVETPELEKAVSEPEPTKEEPAPEAPVSRHVDEPSPVAQAEEEAVQEPVAEPQHEEAPAEEPAPAPQANDDKHPCPSCGHRIKNTAKFCPICGEKQM